MTVASFIREQPAIARGTVLSPVPPLLEKVLIVGSGTSYHAARIAAASFAVPVRVMIPSDALHDAELKLGPDVLVVGVSQSGRSTGTLAVLDRAEAAGSQTLLVSGQPSPRHVTLDIGCGPEPVGAKTKGFTATVLTLQALAGLAPHPGLDVLLSDLIDRSAPTVDALIGTAPPTAVHIVTWGSWRPAADEGALKILETSLLPAEVWDVEEFLHGPHRRLSPTSLLVIVGDRDPRGQRADALTGFVHGLGARVLDVRDLLPDGAPVLAAVIPLQLLAVKLTIARGLSPEADPFPDFHRLLGSKHQLGESHHG
ncbi:SIS domain-containing protein [Actinoplanes derwentensis]|uniref:SIS domain-containing protein n=1 Tax=Actinoplanes derwentensis TaxID=113562 RepID=A0A1H1ST76_9ACTN|nr:SIS domain-containing protein [Actinoplanes derwentensis]GID83214.1 glutamine-fructose-6-phosphate transaminase [Actinoplanes derwentensis]SDS51220.1 SIS domain-containing protein [Actinoplanes derwentensis]